MGIDVSGDQGVGGVVGGVGGFGANSSAWQYAQYDSGYTMGPYSVGANWSVDSPAASLDPDGGHTTAMTGEDADIGGAVTLFADMGCQERYSWDGQNCYDNNFCDSIGDSSSVKIAGVSNALMVESIEYGDGTADFYTISPCPVNCKASGSVRIRLECLGQYVQYEYRTEYWVRNEPLGPTVCLGALKVVKYSGFCGYHEDANCFDTILAP
ncbi:MAG TPA: hypothetical protein VNG71_01630 [Pyrinomonadaceae bacterium]|nr:hypothetical protein [Pyrinomonadaceae bacterium]